MQHGASSINYSNLYHLNTWEQAVLASFQGHPRGYDYSKEPDCCKLWWCTLFLRRYTQISPGRHPDCRFPRQRTARVRSAVFALSQCLLCQIYFGLKVEEICPSAKGAQLQIRKIKPHFWLLIGPYWIQGTNARQGTELLEFSLCSFQMHTKLVRNFKANNDSIKIPEQECS